MFVRYCPSSNLLLKLVALSKNDTKNSFQMLASFSAMNLFQSLFTPSQIKIVFTEQDLNTRICMPSSNSICNVYLRARWLVPLFAKQIWKKLHANNSTTTAAKTSWKTAYVVLLDFRDFFVSFSFLRFRPNFQKRQIEIGRSWSIWGSYPCFRFMNYIVIKSLPVFSATYGVIENDTICLFNAFVHKPLSLMYTLCNFDCSSFSITLSLNSIPDPDVKNQSLNHVITI